MKKNMIALLLSIVMATGSISGLPVFAEEITTQGAVAAEVVSAEGSIEKNEDVDNDETVKEFDEAASLKEGSAVSEQDPTESAGEAAGTIETSEIDARERTENDSSYDIADTSSDSSSDTSSAMPSGASSDASSALPSDSPSAATSVISSDASSAASSDTTSDAASVTEVAEETAVIEESASEGEDMKAALANGEEFAASGSCGDNITWTLDREGTLTISGSGEMEDPAFSEVAWQDYRDQITAIIINEGVTSIGDYAFRNCTNIASIILPQSLRVIGEYAFYYASGPSVLNLPDNLKTIYGYAFEGMQGVQEIAIPDSVVDLREGAFYNCNELRSVTIGNGVTSILEETFMLDTALEQVVLPEKLQCLAACAFSGCSALKRITIPSTVTVIEYEAFYQCSSLEEVVLPDNLSVISEETFSYCTGLSRIEIPDSVTKIEKQAFAYCESISEIALPAKLEILEDGAFLGCKRLNKVILPENEIDFGDNAFAVCAENLQFLDRNEQIVSGTTMGEITPAESHNKNYHDYSVWNRPVSSYLVDEGARRLRVEYSSGVLTKEYYSNEGSLISKDIIPMELPLFGGFFAGSDSYYLVFGQTNYEEDDSKEVLRIVKYSREWIRQSAASIYGENTIVPFQFGTLSMTEFGGMLYAHTCHVMYKSDDGKNHQTNFSFIIREADMTVTFCGHAGYVGHSFNQIIREDGDDMIAVDHGDAYPRGIVLHRFIGKAGAETLRSAEELIVFKFAGEIGDNSTGATLGAFEVSSTHYLVTGNSVTQEEENYDPDGTRNIFIVSTPKSDYTKAATKISWITSYNNDERVSTPLMTSLPNDRFLLMWTVDDVLNYCFVAADGSIDGTIRTGDGELSDCQPYVKENAVWWYVTEHSAPIYYYISLDDPDQVHVQNPGHTVTLDPMGGTLDTTELEVQHKNAYGELPVPRREAGYEFLGWYTGKKHGIKVTSDTRVRVRESETLYAHWVRHWSFSEDTGTLTVYNNDYGEEYDTNWESFRKRIENVIISDAVTRLDAYAFKNCVNLKSATLPEGLTCIEGGAFYGCSKLRHIVIPNGVTDIGNEAFWGCSRITSITIPKSITYVGSYAFGPDDTNTAVRFRGTKAQWNDAIAESIVHYKSIVFNCFSADADFRLSGTSFNYTGKEIRPTVTVTYNGQQLIEGPDYRLVYRNNTNAGKASVYIKGIGKYSGTETKTFTIKKLANTITAKNFAKTYSTKAQVIGLGVKIKNGTPTYKSNNKSVTVSKAGKVTVKAKFIGKATITITAPEKTNYSKQIKKITITVNPTKTALASVTSPSAGKMTVKWKKNAVGAGYLFQYSTSSKFASPKTVWITNNTTLTKTIGSLVKGKKYYVRIRTYKTVGKTKFYSAWSAAKAVTVKK